MNPDLFIPQDVPPDLQPYVRRILVAYQTHPVDLTFDVPATGYCYFGWIPRGRWRAWVNDAPEFDSDRDGRLHLSGQIKDARVKCELSGKVVQAFAELSAVGQYQLFHLPGKDTVERALVPPRRSRFFMPETLSSTGQLVAGLQGYLLSLVPAARAVPDHVTEVVRRIEAADGNIRVAELMDGLTVSERQLRRDFTQIVGLSPKTFCRTLQINASLMSLLAMGEVRLAEIAQRHGFADQAHMTRSFVAFLGEAPMALSEGIEQTIAKFVGQSRAR